MKTVLFAVITFLLVPAQPAQAFDPWAKEDTAREVGYLVLHLVDWGQTRDISRRGGEGYWEVNPVLGKHPSVRRVDSYFTFSALAHIGIAYALPHDWRRRFQYTTAGLKAGLVIHNNKIGLRVNFK